MRNKQDMKYLGSRTTTYDVKVEYWLDPYDNQVYGCYTKDTVNDMFMWLCTYASWPTFIRVMNERAMPVEVTA